MGECVETNLSSAAAGTGKGGVVVVEEEDGFDFDPTEDELVLHFLRPQLRGFAPRVAGAVVEAEPCAAAPWELLARHGLRDRGYFFAPRRRRPQRLRQGHPRSPASSAMARRSVCGGGRWMHSSSRDEGESVTELGVVVRWCRVRYGFYLPGGERGGQMRSTGWVMVEYEITDPRCYRRADDGEEDHYWVLCHVRRSTRAPPSKPKAAAAGAGAHPPTMNP